VTPYEELAELAELGELEQVVDEDEWNDEFERWHPNWELALEAEEHYLDYLSS
jgi:hypothetical protein